MKARDDCDAPARVEMLRSTGTLIKAGRTLSYAEADVRTGDGRLVAHGTSTLMPLPDLGVKLGIPLWRTSGTFESRAHVL